MKVYTYSLFYRLLYKFGNIPLSFFLILFLAPIIVELNKKPILLLPVIITLLMIYLLNKNYLEFYKILSYKIEVDGDRIICSDFLLSKKRIEFRFLEITALEGGIFNGRLYGVMKIKTENNFTVGFFNSIKGAKELETIILSKVKRPIYDDIVSKLNLHSKSEVKEEKK